MRRHTLPIKCNAAGQPEETAFSKLGCPWSSDSADIQLQISTEKKKNIEQKFSKAICNSNIQSNKDIR